MQVGDVVILKNKESEYSMIIEKISVDNDWAECIWMIHGEVKRDSFKIKTIKLLNNESKEKDGKIKVEDLGQHIINDKPIHRVWVGIVTNRIFEKYVECPWGEEDKYCLWDKVELAKKEVEMVANRYKEKPMNEGLCWKCKERLEAKGRPLNDPWGVDPFLHCHHEPKEKPKCWCEIHFHFIGDYALHENEKLILTFCPQCGRKLTEGPMIAPENLRAEIDVHPKRGNF